MNREPDTEGNLRAQPNRGDGESCGRPSGNEGGGLHLEALNPLDCWNQVGVYGDKRCTELQTFVHCRNCPVYSTAGLQLLQREVPDAYRQEWTSHFARKRQTTAPEDGSAVIFKISTEWLALPTRVLQEVAERRAIHSLPHRKGGILLGVANVRGELVLCISIGHLLRIERVPSQATLRTQYRRLLVANGFGDRVAFPVDEISGIERFRSEDLKKPPPGFSGPGPNFTRGILDWQGKAVGLLDGELLLATIDRNLT